MIVGVHIDLKGLAYKAEYIPELLQDLADQRINTILVEYEDLFPFEGMDIAWDEEAVWTKKMVADFVSTAAGLGIEIIPLQQCLGHLQYLLRWTRYRHMAENADYPRTLCLSSEEGKKIVREMLRQVIEAHPESRYVHIGMDEAVGMAACPECAGRGDVLTLFIDYLKELCGFVESYGKTPIIWSDMLEDNFQPEKLSTLKDRFVLCIWDYFAKGKTTPFIRINGWRSSREWSDPANAADIPRFFLSGGYTEDLSQDIQALIEPYREGLNYKTLLSVDLWTKMGFKVLGAGACRMSYDGPAIPYYHDRFANMCAWSESVRRNGQLGVIATSWARGSTFHRPNYPTELIWPIITHLSKAFGKEPLPFWDGLPTDQSERLFSMLGIFRERGLFEKELQSELAEAGKLVRTHRYEWDGLMLLVEIWQWRLRVERWVDDAENLQCGCRAVEGEWLDVIRKQEDMLAEAVLLRSRVQRHFEVRYHGKALEEWLRALFEFHEEDLHRSNRTAQRRLEAAGAIDG